MARWQLSIRIENYIFQCESQQLNIKLSDVTFRLMKSVKHLIDQLLLLFSYCPMSKDKVASSFKGILHPKTIMYRKFHLDILFEPMLFIFFKKVCTSSGTISGPKMQLRLPVFVAPMASIQGSNGQYSRLQGQYFRLQGQYFKLHVQYFSSRGRILVLSLRYCLWSQSTAHGAKVLAMELKVLALEPEILALKP